MRYSLLTGRLAAIQELWKHVEPYAGPAWHQAQHALKPLMDNLPPVVTDTIAKANKELHGHEPLTVIITTALGSLLLFRCVLSQSCSRAGLQISCILLNGHTQGVRNR